ncbi:MAG: M20 family metallopeptidase [Candidatus Omnitrophica bacterium]|nr:M20 family metallopeptidase [Candidatus Omnitrophota bacterium]
MANKKRLIKLLRKLIAIDSQNPPGDESCIARFVAGYLEKMGLDVKIYEFKRKRSNVVSIWKARDAKPSLLITPHLDTVPAGAGWHTDPFTATIKKARVYGLGATDCKGNLAVALEAMNSLCEARSELNYTLIFTATADEESGSVFGLLPLLEKKIICPGAAVVLDADDFKIIVTQKGLIHAKVKIQGKRAHGAYPWRGINAIEKASAIIMDLKKIKYPRLKNNYLKPPTINTGTIKGGDKVNIVADWCEFELDFRFLPGMSSEVMLKELRRIISRHSAKFKIEIEGIQQPYAIDTNHPLVVQLKKAICNAGIHPKIEGSEGATVISFFQKLGIPAVATGFGSAGCAHSANEFIRIDNLYRGALMLEQFLRTFKS